MCRLTIMVVESMQQRANFTIPPFLLREPALPGIPWRFEEPSLASVVCQLCTSEQMTGPQYAALAARLGVDPELRQRKNWEYIYILAAIIEKGLFAPGRRGLGFGTGREPLPSAFAKGGVFVSATDAPASVTQTAEWNLSKQWTEGLLDLWHPELIDRELFMRLVEYRPADMNSIPDDLTGYDFCWSSCCLEHLGSLRHGLEFIKNSLKTLRPGGIAVHTTEFNLQSNADTHESSIVCLYRKKDIELVLHELVREGHSVEPLNLWPGATLVDEHVDVPPYSSPHLKLELAGYVTTSIGMIITKRPY